jgi:hypothetical protein
MRAAFGIAVGIAAVDALLAAFTAVTLLALVIVSPSKTRSASLAKDTVLVFIEKSAFAGEARVPPVRLQLDIENPTDPRLIFQLASSAHTMLAAKPAQSGTMSAEQLFRHAQGQLIWSDRPCSEAKCSSYLWATAGAGTWKMRVRLAGVEPENAPIPPRVKITIHLLDPDQKCERELTPDGQVRFSVNFSGAGNVGC